MRLGKILNTFRKKANLTQTDVSEEIGLCGPQAIYNYEKDKRLPDLFILSKLSKLYKFKCTIDEGEIYFKDKTKNTEGINMNELHIENIKKDLSELLQDKTISIGDMIDSVTATLGEKYNAFVGWNGFLPIDSEFGTFEKKDLNYVKKFILDNLSKFYYWEYYVEIKDISFTTQIHFNLLEEENLICIIDKVFDSDIEDTFEYFTDILFEYAIRWFQDETLALKINNITIL